MLQVAEQADLLVVEDNPYGLLGFDGDPVPAMRSLDAERVVYLGSFSKTFAPGFRVGWVLAPHAVREKLVLAQESATLCPPTFSQFAVAVLPAEPRLARPDQDLPRDVPGAARRDAGRAGRPHAGRHLVDGAHRRLLRLGDACHPAWTRTPCCRARSPPGSRTCPAPASTPTGSAAGTCGCPTASRPPERIIEGTRRLGEVLQYETDVLATFGTARTRHGPRRPAVRVAGSQPAMRPGQNPA